ncbi:MAG: gliding motility-associated C-terminal domain-containing protein [Saprospiraceae bacterium]
MLKNGKEIENNVGLGMIMKKLMCVIFIAQFVFSMQLTAQNNYSLRFDLASLDTTTKIACYYVQIANLGPNEWALGGVNLNILYDSSAACYIDSSAEIVNNENMDYALGSTQSTKISAPAELSGIPFFNTLGYLRISIIVNPVSSGLTLPPDSTYVSFFKLCFDIVLQDITDPNTCFQMSFLNEDLKQDTTIGFPADIVQEHIINGLGGDVLPGVNIDLIPNQSLSSCFVLEENSEDICSDGIDNDEDGLIDCQDSECASFCPEDNSTTCNDGIDNDGDGMIDCMDDSCLTQEDFFTPKGPDSCPDLNNGQLVFSFKSDEIELSIDGGMTYIDDTIISNLKAGAYIVFYRNKNTMCGQESFFSPVVLDNEVMCEKDTTEASIADCSDGIDNDEDGLADCQDTDCANFSFCMPEEENIVFVPNVFSLNSTGINGQLMPLIKDNKVIQILSFAVYDRIGNRVFQIKNVASNDPALMWDGSWNNRKVSSGVYVYHIRLDNNGLLQTFTGDITALE